MQEIIEANALTRDHKRWGDFRSGDIGNRVHFGLDFVLIIALEWVMFVRDARYMLPRISRYL